MFFTIEENSFVLLSVKRVLFKSLSALAESGELFSKILMSDSVREEKIGIFKAWLVKKDEICLNKRTDVRTNEV